MSKMTVDELVRKRQVYKSTFGTQDGQRVIEDLKRFCRAEGICANIDNVYATYVCEGRREVWLRIQKFLSIDDGDIYKLAEEIEDDDIPTGSGNKHPYRIG